jgi:hypothetical protein
MTQKNPLEEAMAFYLRVVDEAIEERGKPDGSFTQQGNIDLMRDMIRQSPKSAQIVIQTLYHSSRDSQAEGQDTARLHGLWLTIAYLLEYGKMDPSSLMLKRMANDFYDAAIETMKEQGL